jgi:hypothetical protein
MDKAIELDSTNTLAYFNRALLHSEQSHLNEAMADLNTVLRHEPGNALTCTTEASYRPGRGFRIGPVRHGPRHQHQPQNVLAYSPAGSSGMADGMMPGRL